MGENGHTHKSSQLRLSELFLYGSQEVFMLSLMFRGEQSSNTSMASVGCALQACQLEKIETCEMQH